MAASPSSEPHGSPDDLAHGGTRAIARVLEAWWLDVDDAIRRARTPQDVVAGVRHAIHSTDRSPLYAALYVGRMRSWMLGSLDVDHELGTGPKKLAADGGTRAQPFVQIPFQEAIDAFAKRRSVTKDVWTKMNAAQRSEAFTVAGTLHEEYVETIRGVIHTSLKEGVSVSDFRKRIGDAVVEGGFTPIAPHRAETVYRNAISKAYSDGRRARMSDPVVVRSHPYWEISGVDDKTTRETHRKCHGITLPADDPVWQRMFPPLGFRCRCVATARRKPGPKSGTSADFPQLAKVPDEGWTCDVPPIPKPEVVRDAKGRPAPAPPPAEEERAALQPPPARAIPMPSPSPAGHGEPLTTQTANLLGTRFGPAQAREVLDRMPTIETIGAGGLEDSRIAFPWGEPMTPSAMKPKDVHKDMVGSKWIDAKGRLEVVPIAKLRSSGETVVLADVEAAIETDAPEKPIAAWRRPNGEIVVARGDDERAAVGKGRVTTKLGGPADVTARYLRGATHVLIKVVDRSF